MFHSHSMLQTKAKPKMVCNSALSQSQRKLSANVGNFDVAVDCADVRPTHTHAVVWTPWNVAAGVMMLPAWKSVGTSTASLRSTKQTDKSTVIISGWT